MPNGKNGFERQAENVMALDVKMKMRLWTSNWRYDSERRTKMNNDSESQMKNQWNRGRISGKGA